MLRLVASLAYLMPGLPGSMGDLPIEKKDVRAVVEGSNRLAFDLLGTFRGRGGNLAFSPASLSIALAMTAEGARGETAAEMIRTLKLPADPAARRRGFRDLLRAIEAGKAAESPRLDLANAVWVDRTDAILPSYATVVEGDYRAETDAADFRRDPEGSRRSINGWVGTRTRGLIPDLIPAGAIDKATSAVLVNAMALKADWAEEFPRYATSDGDFRATPERAVRVRMMNRTGEYAHTLDAAEGVQVLSIPYRGGPLAMVVVLPTEVDGLARVEAGLTAAKVDGWLKAAKARRVRLRFPKFRASTSLELTRTLASLGMPRVFTASADLGGITRGGLVSISAVVHQAVVKVDEEGTEAAAATAIMAPGSMAPAAEAPPIPFVADHPFLHLIRDAETGLILFLGRVADPSR